MTLDEHLGRYYRAAVLNLEPLGPALADLRQALADDPALVAQAKARLAATSDVDEQRCFISKQHRDCLSAALGAT